jgi:hypothetical protein
VKLLIVGGVAGGASAAARARRLSEDAEIVLFERGPDVSFANCGLPYYLGGEIAVRDKLLACAPSRPVARDGMGHSRVSRQAGVNGSLTGRSWCLGICATAGYAVDPNPVVDGGPRSSRVAVRAARERR